MKIYNPKKPILSIHIPKCGGQSLVKVLREWYKENLVEHYFDEKNGKMPIKYQYKKYWGLKNIPYCIHGHFNGKRGFGVDDYYPEIDQAFTFLRDPLEMQISGYFFLQRKTKNETSFRDGKVYTLDKDLDSYLENSKTYLKYFLPTGLNLQTLDYFMNNYFITIGFMDSYQESLDKLADTLNKPRVIVPYENISERNVIPSEKSVRVFIENSKEEIEIYNAIRKKCGL